MQPFFLVYWHTYFQNVDWQMTSLRISRHWIFQRTRTSNPFKLEHASFEFDAFIHPLVTRDIDNDKNIEELYYSKYNLLIQHVCLRIVQMLNICILYLDVDINELQVSFRRKINIFDIQKQCVQLFEPLELGTSFWGESIVSIVLFLMRTFS